MYYFMYYYFFFTYLLFIYLFIHSFIHAFILTVSSLSPETSTSSMTPLDTFGGGLCSFCNHRENDDSQKHCDDKFIVNQLH